MPDFSEDRLNEALGLLAEEMAAEGLTRHELVVCGGSALLALRLSLRTTKDVDILARLDEAMDLAEPKPLAPELVQAARRVGRLLALPEDWLNTGPSDQLKGGLPSGFVERLVAREFGPALRIHYASRYDLIHLKLFALVDQGPGKHLQDLRALRPTDEEMLAAARWVLTQDAGAGFPDLLRDLLTQLGHAHLAAQI